MSLEVIPTTCSLARPPRRPPGGGAASRFGAEKPWARCTPATCRSSGGPPGDCDFAAMTDYVNPLQFGPAEDLDAYHDLERGLRPGPQRPGRTSCSRPPPRTCAPAAPTRHRDPGGGLTEGIEEGGSVPATSTGWRPSSPNSCPWRARAGPTSWSSVPKLTLRLVLSFPSGPIRYRSRHARLS